MSDTGRGDAGLLLAGWVLAFVLPIGGVVAGILLAARRPVNAFGMIIASAFVVGVYTYLLASLTS